MRMQKHHRIEAWMRPDFPDPVGGSLARRIKADLGVDAGVIRTRRALTLLGRFSSTEVKRVAKELFWDPVVEELSFDGAFSYGDCRYAVEVSFLPGVTDNVARSAAEGIGLLLGRSLKESDHVFSSSVYLFHGGGLSREAVESVCRSALYNQLIERVEILSADELAAGALFSTPAPPVASRSPKTETIRLGGLTDYELVELSRSRCLALSLDEMKAIQKHYRLAEVASAREAVGLGPEPTDVELECYAQTWSEHCKHKIFSAVIEYEDESGKKNGIDSIFRTFISDPTRNILEKRDDVLSVFTDNAGVFSFDENWDICLKVETHNSPSALEPYGGAMTGIVGVNRDVLGTGRGFKPIFNTDVFCFGPPDFSGTLPKELMHPRRILRGVHRGVRDGGNQSGIPTVNGSISFDERFLGKPLVYCGTAGIAPRLVAGRPSHEKWLKAGDRIVMIGGRIGKDGIHGATFSSERLSEASPVSAVQIGDPITQRRMTDFLMVARDAGLYGSITDNGAGGLSSSIGEMARESNGARVDLSGAPLKYPGLAPWEIFLSEAQERMSVAVPQESLGAFMELAGRMDVSATCLGEFTSTGLLEIFHAGAQVARIDMAFLHEGLPRLKLKARWAKPGGREPEDGELPAVNAALGRAMLSRFNICSKEDWVRQYDHEVQGMSVVKPFSGAERDGPSDAAVIRPDLRSWRGLAVSHGVLPRYCDIDGYHMAGNVVDEALRSLVCVGADPESAVGLDNFCWPDPVESPANPGGSLKLAQLVRTCMGLADATTAYGLPCISGKDSMKNDFASGGVRISIPPTLLFSAAAIVPDVREALTMDFKRPGDFVYLLGATHDELGASELYDHLGLRGLNIPKVRTKEASERYRTLFGLIRKGVVASAHDLSEGGLFVALAESCFGGRLGAVVNLDAANAARLHPTRMLFSESASRILVSVSPERERELMEAFPGGGISWLGMVTEKYSLRIAGSCEMDLSELYGAWRSPLSDAT